MKENQGLQNQEENFVKESCYFVFYKGEILLKEDGEKPGCISKVELQELKMEELQMLYIGEAEGKSFYAVEAFLGNQKEGFSFKDIDEIYDEVSQEIFSLAMRGLHLVNWLGTHRYCGCCGSKLTCEIDKNFMECENCGHITYPRITPAIIVAVVKEDKLLLARSPHFPPELFSLISGHVDPGESIEDTVSREVREEVGIEIKNIRYFGSNPWPFPDKLMLGFIAEYASGEIKIDNNEIEAAGWYSLDDMPKTPDYKLSFAKKMIGSLLGDNTTK